jgi:polar amino acid transport system permease protein
MTGGEWLTWLPDLLGGLLVSLQLTCTALIIGLPLGLLLGIASTSQIRSLRWTVIVIVDLFRGMPLLVVLYLIYFGLPSAGLTFSAWIAAVIALSINTGAYTSEIFRAGVLSVPRGHIEAGKSLGLTDGQTTRRIVLPQALKTVTPPIVSNSILVFHGTSLASVIAVSELTSRAFNIGSVTFEYLSVLVLAGALYATVSIAVSRLVHGLHNRKSRNRGRPRRARKLRLLEPKGA